MSKFFETLQSGGLVMLPLGLASVLIWAVIFERIWRYRRLGRDLQTFFHEATNCILRNEFSMLSSLCTRNPDLPTAKLLAFAVERIRSLDPSVQIRWKEAVERKRQLINQELRQYLWVLGTTASAAPFVGLFGTVVGILRSFSHMAETGKSGFAVVASGISEALIATAAGILVAVIAVLAFNAFQTRWSQLVLVIRIQTEEFVELLSSKQEMIRGTQSFS